MGEVYRATDSVLSRPVAVKLLADRHGLEDEARARFRREATAAARLSSAPNVVTVFDVAEHRGRPLIVMEYLEGGSVHDRLQSGRVPRRQALTWLEQAAGALDRAHEHGVVHRDVKPANLLLDRDGNVHVSDFGIASTTSDDTLTIPGTVLGTAGYLSPEQARGEPATPASDRYALGVVAFELLTGRRPFAGDTPTTEAFAHLHADVPSATALDPALPAEVDAVFRRALAKEPSERPGTAQELVTELRDALAATAAPAPTRPLPLQRTAPVLHRSRRMSRGVLVAVALTALLVAGLATAALVAAGGDDPRSAASREPQSGGATSSGSTTTETTSTTGTSIAEGIALGNQGFELQEAGDYAAALPLLRRAVIALNGSGVIEEAYASYNLAFSRFAADPGRCDGITALLDRSERIQGHREQIDELRQAWQERCGQGEDGAEGPGKGKGHGRGKDKD